MTCDTVNYTTSTGNATRGSRSWTTTSATAFTEEDRKITCKAEGIEYTTTIGDYPEIPYDIELPVEENYYTISTAAAGGTYSDSVTETYTPVSYDACCSGSCEKNQD